MQGLWSPTKCWAAVLAELALKENMNSVMQLMLAIAAFCTKPRIFFQSDCCLRRLTLAQLLASQHSAKMPEKHLQDLAASASDEEEHLGRGLSRTVPSSKPAQAQLIY